MSPSYRGTRARAVDARWPKMPPFTARKRRTTHSPRSRSPKHAKPQHAVARTRRGVGSPPQIFFQGHCKFYFYFLFISQALAEIFRPIFLASRYHFSKFCQGCESEGRVDSVRARPRLRARLGGSEDSWWAFGEAVCVGASS